MKETKSKRPYSRRAPILKRVLECVNANDFEDHGDYMVFGNMDPETDEQSVDTEAVREFLNNIMKDSGTAESAKRVSLDAVPVPSSLPSTDRLPAGFLRDLHAALHNEDVKKALSIVRTPGQIEAGILDCLDARYASEVVENLEKIVSKAFTLDPVEINQIPSQNVREYFREAHNCYLFGHGVACAVLCRALLESALVQKVDPKGSIENDVNRRGSYVLALVEKAQSAALLSDDRPEWAKTINKAGGLAVHNMAKFNKVFPADRLGQILDNTRKILIDLYS